MPVKRLITLLTFALSLFATALARKGTTFTVLQWNIWQEGTSVPGGFQAIVDEIVRLKPDFVTFSEVRNYRGTRFDRRIVGALRARGETYHSFYSYDSGLLSRHPIEDTLVVYPCVDDHGSIHKLIARVDGHPVAIYTAHLDYLNCAYYDVRGYDGSSWRKEEPCIDLEEVLRINTASRRDDGIRAFIAEARKDLDLGRSVVIGGDFNEPSHLDWTSRTSRLYDHHGLVIPWTVTTLLQQAGYRDAFRTIYPNERKHPGFTYPADNPLVEIKRLTWAPQADERERIDYIFYQGPGLCAIQARIFGPEGSIARGARTPDTSHDTFLSPIGTWPSDHKGLLVTFRQKDR